MVCVCLHASVRVCVCVSARSAFNWACLHECEWEVIYWTMDNLTAATPLKKTTAFHHSLSRVLQGGVEPTSLSPFHDETFISSIAAVCSRVQQPRHAWKSASWYSSPTCGSDILPTSPTAMFPEPLRGAVCVGGGHKDFCGPEHPSHSSSGLWPVAIPYLDPLCLTSSIQNSFSVCTKESQYAGESLEAWTRGWRKAQTSESS